MDLHALGFSLIFFVNHFLALPVLYTIISQHRDIALFWSCNLTITLIHQCAMP